MATAAKLLGQVQTIDIDVNGQANPPDIVLSGGMSDSIEFTNLYHAAVAIHFVCANGPVFNDIPSILPGKTSAQQYPQKTQITTDFKVEPVGGLTQGPYGIQVGIGTPANPAPLLIPVTGGSPAPDQGTISVPPDGWIQFDIQDNVAYEVNWDWPAPPDAFNTPAPPKTIGPGLTHAYQAKQGLQLQEVSYTLTAVQAARRIEAPGHGTVHINA